MDKTAFFEIMERALPLLWYLTETYKAKTKKNENGKTVRVSHLRTAFRQATSPDGAPIPGVYKTLIVGSHDDLLIELGNKHKFARGLTAVYEETSGDMSMKRFYPKFDNDDRQDEVEVSEGDFAGAVSAAVTLKLSGHLIKLFPVLGTDNQFHWVVETKNGDDPVFVKPAWELIKDFATEGLARHMHENGLTACFECMTEDDQTHGARVFKPSVICTCVSRDAEEDNVMSDYMSHDELSAFCREHSIPICTSYQVDDVHEFVRELNLVRDGANLDTIVTLLNRFGSVIQGTVDHVDVLGDVLEGLVIFMKMADGSSKTLKYKFPCYTLRTFFVRQAIKDHLKPEHPFRFTDGVAVQKRIDGYIRHWVVSQDSRKHVDAYLWACVNVYRVLHEDAAGVTSAPLLAAAADVEAESGSKVALHIRIADAVRRATEMF
nr:putative tRNA ligase [Oceanusvirus sp.]